MVHRIDIVLVDDNPTERLLFEDAMLASKQYVKDVQLSNGGPDLLLRLRGDHPDGNSPATARPDLIILDLNMPGMNGFEVLELLAADKEFCKMPVVVLSGSNDAEDIKRCYKLGASGFVVKPETHDELIAMFKRLTRYWAAFVKVNTKHAYI
ncbi:MAG: response regulator [Cohaesibacteraceae bacterium]|nr:response regulator [Cohaesibacteraceae bacterium]